MNMLWRIALITALAAFVVGCGDSGDDVAVNTVPVRTNAGTGNVPVLSGRTGQLRLQTVLARQDQVTAQEVTVIQGQVIPEEVDSLRFIGLNSNGIPIYGPIVRDKNTLITLNDVPVEVTSLRIELLTDGFTVGGVSTPVDITSGEIFVLATPTFVFPGIVDPDAVVSPSVVYGSFVDEAEVQQDEIRAQFTEPEIIDFPTSLTTNGVTRTGVGTYQVSQEGDYLLTYSVEIDFTEEEPRYYELHRNGQPVPNTLVDLAEIFFGGRILAQGPASVTGLQSFQYIVTLSADDEVSLRSRPEEEEQMERAVRAQELEVVELFQGTFTIVRMGPGTAD